MPTLGAESALRIAPLTCEPWLWSARRDLAVFGGSALGALGIVALGHAFGFGGGALPEWGFLLFVLGVDVAHVYATLFRTYLDKRELRARPARYALTPLLSYLVGVAAYAAGALVFWRALAYLALFHFVRQEIGWLRVQRAKAHPTRLDARLDELALYVSALYPVLLWHADPAGRNFSWFMPGDFATLPAAFIAALPVARALACSVLIGFALRQLWLVVTRGVFRALPCLIVGKTAVIWYVGIALCNSDFDFTVTNVVAHGVPYLVLLWSYAREHAALQPSRTSNHRLGARLAAGGVFAFFGLLLVLAATEEWAWDAWVFHERAWLFGEGTELSAQWLAWLVPLLAVPQLTHYWLDSKLWRAADTRRLPAQQRALGLASAEGT